VSAPPPGERDERLTPSAHAQESTYGKGVDYVAGSPHPSHHGLHSRLVGRLRRLVDATFARTGRCRILEVGGGHGTFTEQLAALGAEVTVSEISKASAEVLSRRFHRARGISVFYDPDGEAIFTLDADFDLVLCISVLHHIPDYLRFAERLTLLLRPGGALAAYQDPDWYPRRARRDHSADCLAYYGGRVTQGNLLAGMATVLRRFRGGLNETLPADMTEYHVVRQGVDDLALAEQLHTSFTDVEVFRYWSTQAAPLQRLGERLGWQNTFGLEARGRRDEGPT